MQFNVTKLSRYDILLAMISLALLAAWIVGHAFGLPDWIALGLGALAVLPALVDGLALNPPARTVEPDDSCRRGSKAHRGNRSL